MKKGVLLISFLVLGIFLINVVSAVDTNLALQPDVTAEGNLAFRVWGYQRIENPYNAIDDSLATKFGGGDEVQSAGIEGFAKNDITLTFPSAVEVNRIQLVSDPFDPNDRCMGKEITITYEDTSTEVITTGVECDSFEITGTWSNVKKVKYWVYVDNQGPNRDRWATHYVQEFRVWGTEEPSCVPTTCAAEGYTCGMISNGTCGGPLLNCSVGQTPCNQWEGCEAGSCVIQDNCPDNRTIMKLYSPENSHGALWNDGNYLIDICYQGAEVPADPHTCTGSNKVVGLYQPNNSHAEIPSFDVYPEDVCYGDLSCVAEYNTTGCSSGIPILSLYQNNNSHLGAGDVAGYDWKICCSTTLITDEVYWADMNGNNISEADIGDTVLMIYPGQAGQDHDFVITEDGDTIVTITETFDYGTALAAKWTINQDNIDDAQKWYEFWDLGQVEFRFTVDNLESDILNVLEGSNDDPDANARPSTQITAPIAETNYTMDSGTTGIIPFTQISSDEDDDLKLEWDFDDGNITIFENIIETGLGDTSHQYTEWGTQAIKLTASEMVPPRTATEAQKDIDVVRIYVYNTGINVFAIIDSPNPDEVEHIEGRVVEIDATRSHASECFDDSASCDAQSANCYEVVDNLGVNPPLYCYDFPQAGLIMEWTFDEGTDQELIKTGVYGTDNVVQFTHVFDEAGEHTLKLRVGYDAS